MPDKCILITHIAIGKLISQHRTLTTQKNYMMNSAESHMLSKNLKKTF